MTSSTTNHQLFHYLLYSLHINDCFATLRTAFQSNFLPLINRTAYLAVKTLNEVTASWIEKSKTEDRKMKNDGR